MLIVSNKLKLSCCCNDYKIGAIYVVDRLLNIRLNWDDYLGAAFAILPTPFIFCDVS